MHYPTFKLLGILARELHFHVVAEEENTLSCVDEDAPVGMGSVQSHLRRISVYLKNCEL